MSPFYDFQGKAHMKVEIYHLSQNGLNRCRTTLPSSVSIPIYQNIQNPTLTLATILGFVKNPPESWLYMDLALATNTEPFAQPARLLSLRACQVRSEDSEEVSSGESIVLDEQTLMRELQVAIEEENYTQAAKIRDSLKVLQEDSKASVLAANARFYNAFRKGDLAAMQSLWEKADNVCCVHPGASGVLGYDDVMESWEVVWMNYDFPLDIELKNVRVHFRGDVGYVTCVEFVRTKGRSWGAQFVTNVFEKIDGQWFISIHHASPVDL
ncbi:hypothetical protein POPTR_006G093700v4 [Populus trichocarpa]|uniref:Uncharacterized protein n=1 Tax=Populus trichocarpa TaxID=3694 RepID=A0ACC0SU19_POPTR|nr:uncharacterized protein LOC7468027 isoform X2 [Populus trichocarpa]KAI9392464.1 hypothetical protein POPTR_006G093700v4 [Populus trichocarpa]